MKKIEINEDGLTKEQIELEKSKSRAILLDGNRILIANYAGIMLLPGGSIEEGETETQAIFRELREETGVTYDAQDLRKVIRLKHYQPNYPSRDGKIINRVVTTYFYVGNLKGVDLGKTQRTEEEISKNFNLELLEYDEILRRARGEEDDRSVTREYFDREIIEALGAYREIELDKLTTKVAQEIER